MHTYNDFAVIAAIDLTPIKMKLMHRQSGEGWSQQKADAVELEYRRFLYLAKKFPGEQSAPLADVDIFWHYHILDTMKYMTDCDAVFGHYLHHYPYAGLEGGEEDEDVHKRVGDRMKELYEQEFGEGSFGQSMQQMADGEPETGAAWCVIPPAVRPEQANVAMAAAWCVIPPAARMAGLSRPQAASPVMGAWCVIPPASRMSVQARPVAGATKTAWCVIPPASPSKPAATAWCVIPPSAPEAARQPAVA